jgi:hypothetical protein
VARYRDEQRAAAQPVLDWMATVLKSVWGESGGYTPRQNKGPHHEPVATTPLTLSRIFPLKGAMVSALLVDAPGLSPPKAPTLRPGGPNLIEALAEGLDGQRFLQCDYSVGVSGSATRSFAFWYPSPPSSLEALMAIDVGNSLQMVGPKGFNECPATYGEATAEREAAKAYANSPRFVATRESWWLKNGPNRPVGQ